MDTRTRSDVRPFCFFQELPYNEITQQGCESFCPSTRALRDSLFSIFLFFTGAKAVGAQIDHLRRTLKAKTADAADRTLQRHLALFRESQLKVELEKLKRYGKFEEAGKKADELERQIGLLGSYDFKLATLTNEAFDLYRQITELEVEELKVQLQRLRAELRQSREGTERTKANKEALVRLIDEANSAWIEKTTELSQLQDDTSELSRAWREKFLGVQLR